ncbi:hypothetical protein MASR2M78_10100 [Treponema sp.]
MSPTKKLAAPAKPGTPGWYDNLAFEEEAAKAKLPSATLDGDAFSNELKTSAVQAIKGVAAKAGIPAKVDLVVYSLASPVRVDPKDGTMYRSVIKPAAQAYSGLAMDVLTAKLTELSVEVATEEEIAGTVKVMGGEDWELWIEALDAAGVLAPTARTIAPTLTWVPNFPGASIRTVPLAAPRKTWNEPQRRSAPNCPGAAARPGSASTRPLSPDQAQSSPS